MLFRWSLIFTLTSQLPLACTLTSFFTSSLWWYVNTLHAKTLPRSLMIYVALWNKFMAFILASSFAVNSFTDQGRIQDFKKGGGGGTMSTKGASFVGMSGAISSRNCLINWVSKMAIPSILRLISYSSNTNFLLVNFAIVKKKKKKKNYKKGAGGEHRPPGPPPPLDPPLQIHEYLQHFIPLRIWVALHSWTFFFQFLGLVSSHICFAPKDACFCYFEFGRWKHHQIISSGKEI